MEESDRLSATRGSRAGQGTRPTLRIVEEIDGRE
jgi:hypothetical protein